MGVRSCLPAAAAQAKEEILHFAISRWFLCAFIVAQ